MYTTEEDFYQDNSKFYSWLGDIAHWCFKSLLFCDMLYLAYRIINFENFSITAWIFLAIVKMIFKRLRFLARRCVDGLYCLGTSLFVLQNKVLLSGKPLNFFAPLFITWYRFFIMTVIMTVWASQPKLLPSNNYPYRNPIHWPTMKRVLPFTLLYILKTLSENLCLLYSDASFYLLGTSLVSFFDVILSYKCFGRKPSIYTCWACFFVASGFIYAIRHEYLAGTFSAVGLLFSILSSFFYAFYAIKVYTFLPRINNELWVIMFFNNLYSTILFIPLLVFERDEIMNKLMPSAFGINQVLTFVALALSGVVTMVYKLIHIKRDTTIWVTKLESRGISRAHFQLGIVSHWYAEPKPLSWWVASTVTSFGSEWNTIEKLGNVYRRKKFCCVFFTIWFFIIIHFSSIYHSTMPALFRTMK